MFSFFRRSKKDPDASTSRDNKRTNKEKERGKSSSPKLLNHHRHHNRDKDTGIINNVMCKNKPTIEKLFESAPQLYSIECSETSPKILPECELRENNEKSVIVTGAQVCSALNDNEKIDTNINQNSTETTDQITVAPNQAREEKQNQKKESRTEEMNTNHVNAASNYNPFKPTSDVKNVRNVKPCGHGTIAIQPRIPILSSRRDSLTPPESPKSELKNPYKKQKNDDNSSDDSLQNDTINASMKIKLNLPSINSTSVLALTDSITERTTSGNTQIDNDNTANNNNDIDVTYVIPIFYVNLYYHAN